MSAHLPPQHYTHERKDVATLDIPGAFLTTRMPNEEKKVHPVLEGQIAELLAKIAHDMFQEYVHHNQGQAYIYCLLNVALSGTLKVAISFGRNDGKPEDARVCDQSL